MSRYLLLLLIACFVQSSVAQQSLLGIRLQGSTNGNVLSLSGPPGGFTNNYALQFPGDIAGMGALPYLTNGTGQLGWLPASTDGFVLTLSGGIPVWSNPASTTGVNYGVATPQATATPREHFLFNVEYASAAANAPPAGARIKSYTGSGASGQNALGLAVISTVNNNGLATGQTITANTTGTNSGATGLTVTATGSDSGVVNGLNVAVSGGATKYAATFTGGNTGFGTTSPAASIDIVGDFANRCRSVTLSSGVNNNVAAAGYSYLCVAGPAAAYSISGFTGGVDGKQLQIVNLTPYALTLIHQDTGSTASNRIYNAGSHNLTLSDSSTVTLTYSATVGAWLIKSSTGGMTGSNGFTWLRQKTDVSITNSTTFQTATDFDFMLEANATYHIHLVLLDSGVGGAYFTGQAVPPAGTSISGYAFTGVGGSAVQDVDIVRNGIVTNSGGTATLNGKAGYGIGDFVVHTTTGGLSQFRWGMLTSSPSKTLWLLKDSFMVIRRVE